MAALIGDAFPDSSRLHSMLGLQHQHSHSHDPHYRQRSVSRNRERDIPSAQSRTPSATRHARSHEQHDNDWERTSRSAYTREKPSLPTGASLFPSPPSSSSSSTSSSARPQHEPSSERMAASGHHSSSTPSTISEPHSTLSSSTTSSTSTATTVIPAGSSQQIPSPESDRGPRWNQSLGDLAVHSIDSNSTTYLAGDSVAQSPHLSQTTIRVRDLSHIQSLARADLLASGQHGVGGGAGSGSGSGILSDPPLQAMKYEISGMPIGDVIEMVAALLTKITTTNDLQHDAQNRNAAHVRQAQAQANNREDGSSSVNADSMSPLSSSVLAFHGKNVPAITILSYLSRIHKYCPITYEVFLSLLVYFDRMTERINEMVVRAEDARQHLQTQPPEEPSLPTGDVDTDAVMHDEDDDEDDSSEGDEVDSDLADNDEDEEDQSPKKRPDSPQKEVADVAASGLSASNPTMPLPFNQQATYLVVDSFNIHRLIIAGVTCASKFFSDVFYTNSRYAKVGGLPLAELNHLELQFLLLNDFRLAVPVEDLEAYATMLVEFYAREVVAQRSRSVTGKD